MLSLYHHDVPVGGGVPGLGGQPYGLHSACFMWGLVALHRDGHLHCVKLGSARTALMSPVGLRGLSACAGRPAPRVKLAARLMVQLDALWGAINQRSILLPAAFVFLWQVCAATPYFRPLKSLTYHQKASLCRSEGCVHEVL